MVLLGKFHITYVLAFLSLFCLMGCSDSGVINGSETLNMTVDLSQNLTVIPSRTTSPTGLPSSPSPDIRETDKPVSTNTPLASLTPSSTATITITPTDIQTETSTATITPQNSENSSVNSGDQVKDPIRIFFIQENTGGSICGDSLIWINTDIPRSNSTVKNVTSALGRLFSYRTKYVGGYYNPAHVVNAKVKKVTLSEEGFLFIQLAGSMKERPIDDCENIRLRSQIWSTFRQFKGYDKYTIYLDSALLGDLINTDR